jgi:hypothetical protein
MPEASAAASMNRAGLPSKGTSMADVQKKFGEPATRQPTVGGDSAKHPPITRWDYAGFSVIFEKDKVIDAVVPGAPPAIYHQEQLQSTDNAPPMPGAAMAPPPGPPPSPPPPMAAPAETAPPTPSPQAAPPVATPENPNPDRPPQ